MDRNENYARLHGRPRREANWSFDQSLAPKFDPEARRLRTNGDVFSKDEVLGKDIDDSSHRRCAKWSPKVTRPGYPVAKSESVGLQGSSGDVTSKKMWRQWKPGDSEAGMIVTEDGAKLVPLLVEITLPDGTKKKIQPKLRKSTLDVTTHGVTFTLTKTDRGHTILDGRDGKRKSKQFIFDELRRILGAEAGEAAYRQLASV